MICFRKFLIAAAMAFVTATQAGAQENSLVVATHGDWEIRCTEDKQLCTMNQTFNGPDGRPLAFMSFARLKDRTAPNGAKIPAQMEVRVPLGVLLTEGLSIQIDSGNKEVAPFRFCTQGGCRVLAPIPEGFVTALKAGINAQITFRSIDGKDQNAIISLKGFTKAYDSLTPLG